MSCQITCVGWVARGLAKETPDKVELSQEELQRIIAEAKQELGDLAAEEEDEGISCEQTPNSNTEAVAAVPKDENEEEKEEDDELAEYGLDKYDEEDIGEGWGCLCTACVFFGVQTKSFLLCLFKRS